MEQQYRNGAFLLSPWQLFFWFLIIIFLLELMVMFVIMLLEQEHGIFTSIMDATVLVVFGAPVVWYFVVRPLRDAAIAEHMRAAALVARSADAIITANEKGVIESFNPAAEHLFGYRSEEVVGKPLTLLMPERYRAGHSQALERRRSSVEAPFGGKTVESYGLRKDGDEFPFELSVAAWKMGTGARYAGIIRDITERKRADRNLQSRYKELETLHEISRTVLDSLDLRVMMEGILDRVFEMGGFDVGLVRVLNAERGTFESVASRGYQDMKNVHAQHRKITSFTTSAGIPRAMEDQSVQVVDLAQTTGMRTFRAEGVHTMVVVPLRSDKGVLGFIHLGSRTKRQFQESELRILDAIGRQAGIAIQKAQLYEETRKQAAELERANQIQADFTAMIVHDLRSPVMNIIGTADMMAEGLLGPVNEEQKEWLLKLSADGRCLVDLVSDFLDLSKIEAGCVDVIKEEVDLRQLIQDSIASYRPLAREKNIRITGTVHSAVPKIKADPRRLKQVLGNLLSNAVKFAGEGGRIDVGAERGDDGQIRVWVKDNGVGIPSEEIGHLFQKYHQLKSGELSHDKGTGLGLVICKMVVEAHGGKIWAESTEGQGTTFSFTLALSE